MKNTVSTNLLPPLSPARSFLQKIDFEDAYSFRAQNCPDSMEEVYLKIFYTAPLWVEYAMRFRNMLVAPFGLKTEIEPNQSPVVREGEKVGIFRIYKILENEIIAGEDDKHLNFRVSVHRSQEDSPLITVSTLVHYHNSFGRAYMSLIMPFHKMVVKSILKSSQSRFS